MALFNINESLVRLFIRESSGKSLKESDLVDLSIDKQTLYQTWRESKREFVEFEICEAPWIKSCPQGYITEVNFRSDGTLVENRLFDRFETKGRWSLESGILSVCIYKGDNRYEFQVVASASENIHSAIEYKNGELHSYLKLAQVRVSADGN